jgi:putative endonuclease
MSALLRLGLKLFHLRDRYFPRAELSTGAWGERWAARYLQLYGCRILERNARPCRHGEVDLIAKQGKVYLFVEVKTRKNERFGPPMTAIHTKKRQLLRRCATHWLARHRLLNDRTLYRFDGVEVIGTPAKGIPEIRWVRRLDMSETRAPEV